MEREDETFGMASGYARLFCPRFHRKQTSDCNDARNLSHPMTLKTFRKRLSLANPSSEPRLECNYEKGSKKFML